jgi:hypothetical protein
VAGLWVTWWLDEARPAGVELTPPGGVPIATHVVTVNDVLDGHVGWDLECFDRIYLQRLGRRPCGCPAMRGDRRVCRVWPTSLDVLMIHGVPSSHQSDGLALVERGQLV